MQFLCTYAFVYINVCVCVQMCVCVCVLVCMNSQKYHTNFCLSIDSVIQLAKELV